MLHAAGIILLIVIVIALFIGSRAFRWAVLVFIGIVGIGIYALIQSSERAAEEARRRDTARWRRIAISQIEFRDARLSLPRYSGGPAELTATVRNSSAVTADLVALRLRVFDCPSQASEIGPQCDTIGDQELQSYTQVPPQQLRQIHGSVYFTNLPPARGRWMWNYEVLGIRAQQ